MKDPLTKKVYKICYTLLALYYTIWKSIRQVLRLYILEVSPNDLLQQDATFKLLCNALYMEK